MNILRSLTVSKLANATNDVTGFLFVCLFVLRASFKNNVTRLVFEMNNQQDCVKQHRTRKTAQWVTCLPHKYGDLGSDLQHPLKNQEQYNCSPSAEERGEDNPEARWPVNS